MIRFIKLQTSFALCAVFAIAACTSKSDTQRDTAQAVNDTATTSSTVISVAPAAGGSPASTATAASSTPIVRININTATDAEIRSIPGVGPRMLREFKEYRPYTSIEQFRREIGKYVDKAEVARLEQYIVIK
jgi:DNA uptake protein ComE-like DNA-binding protein